MKTDLVEIFQTLRAALYSYQTGGYTVHSNCDDAYELFSEKNRVHNGEKITEFFFVGLYIKEHDVLMKFNAADIDFSDEGLEKLEDGMIGLKIKVLDEQKQNEIASFVEILHAHFKKQEWV